MLIDIAHLIDHKKVEKYQNRYQMATRHLRHRSGDEWPLAAVPFH